MPQARLSELVAQAQDVIATSIDVADPALEFLRRYLAILAGPAGIAEDPSLMMHIEVTLCDLMSLALSAKRDAAHVARTRGLRATRTQEIIVEIKTSFADPSCAPTRVALKLGLSVRYLHELLQDTGLSFSERVIELRLQKARAMLRNPRNDRLKVSEIALACGFNEVSYFNRSFRRRFGVSPTRYRSDGSV